MRCSRCGPDAIVRWFGWTRGSAIVDLGTAAGRAVYWTRSLGDSELLAGPRQLPGIRAGWRTARGALTAEQEADRVRGVAVKSRIRSRD